MKNCTRCGTQNNINSQYCSNCGYNLNYIPQKKKGLYNFFKNDKVFLPYSYFIGLIALYALVGCIMEAKASDGMYDGLTVFIGAPVGAMMCSIVPLISGLIGVFNKKRNNKTITIIQILVLYASIYPVILFNEEFLVNIDRTIFLVIYILMTIPFSIYILYKTPRDIKENNN